MLNNGWPFIILRVEDYNIWANMYFHIVYSSIIYYYANKPWNSVKIIIQYKWKP